MVKMSAFCIVDVVRVKDSARMEEYKKQVRPVVERFGGRFRAAGGRFNVVEGEWKPTHPVIIEFPSLEAVHRWYDSEEYRDLKAMRLSAADGSMVFIEGF
jgi:uncharacterized protein (DUF1330 family)